MLLADGGAIHNVVATRLAHPRIAEAACVCAQPIGTTVGKAFAVLPAESSAVIRILDAHVCDAKPEEAVVSRAAIALRIAGAVVEAGLAVAFELAGAALARGRAHARAFKAFRARVARAVVVAAAAFAFDARGAAVATIRGSYPVGAAARSAVRVGVAHGASRCTACEQTVAVPTVTIYAVAGVAAAATMGQLGLTVSAGAPTRSAVAVACAVVSVGRVGGHDAHAVPAHT